MEFNNYGRDARERLHLGVNLREEPGSLPLKGGPEFSPGFQPWVRRFDAVCPEGAPECGTPRRIHISASAPVISRHFQGAFLGGGYPGLKPWAEFWPPFRGRTRALPLSCTGLKRYKAGNPRLLPVSIEFQRKPRKFSIQRQKPIANRKSNISLPRLSGSDWRCTQILIA